MWGIIRRRSNEAIACSWFERMRGWGRACTHLTVLGVALPIIEGGIEGVHRVEVTLVARELRHATTEAQVVVEVSLLVKVMVLQRARIPQLGEDGQELGAPAERLARLLLLDVLEEEARHVHSVALLPKFHRLALVSWRRGRCLLVLFVRLQGVQPNRPRAHDEFAKR